MIEARELGMSFGSRAVVRNVSFTVEPGAVVGFLGPNGAGKSTTMRMLTGFLIPRTGTALICGNDVRRQRIKAQECVGYLPEAPDGLGHLTVAEFLRFCADARGLRRRRLRERLAEVTEQIALGPALARRLGELSKGWRQRAWLAQALIHDPPVLVLDEPTDGLDPNQKQQVRDLISSIAPDKAILLSTHILEEAEEICDRAVILSDGQIVADETPTSLADDRGRIGAAFRRLTLAHATNDRVDH